MDFKSAMETFAEAWVAANTKGAPLADVATQVFLFFFFFELINQNNNKKTYWLHFLQIN